jgi:hypothetical protein
MTAAILITAAILPAHARGVSDESATVDGVRYAVMDEYAGSLTGGSDANSCPALGRSDAASSCPYLSGLAAKEGRKADGSDATEGTPSSQCPYLASMTAGSDCPALGSGDAADACPYLSGKERREASPPADDETELPIGLSL